MHVTRSVLTVGCGDWLTGHFVGWCVWTRASWCSGLQRKSAMEDRWMADCRRSTSHLCSKPVWFCIITVVRSIQLIYIYWRSKSKDNLIFQCVPRALCSSLTFERLFNLSIRESRRVKQVFQGVKMLMESYSLFQRWRRPMRRYCRQCRDSTNFLPVVRDHSSIRQNAYPVSRAELVF
jgi:hypothetical protein